jgi:O-antigen/teichoic acid export membrane protein
MFVGLIAIPLLIQKMGVELFGLLTVLWVFVGYFSLFDLGLGRAITRLTVEFLEQKDLESVKSVFWVSIKWMGLIASLSAIALFFFANKIAVDLFHITEGKEVDVVLAFRFLYPSLPGKVPCVVF